LKIGTPLKLPSGFHTINEFDFATMEIDFLGRIYKKLIQPLERTRLAIIHATRYS